MLIMAIKLAGNFPQENTDKFTFTFTDEVTEEPVDQAQIYVRVVIAEEGAAIPGSEFGDYNYETNTKGLGNDAILDGDVVATATGVYDFLYTLPNVKESTTIRIEVRAFRIDPTPPNPELKTYQSLEMKLVL
jgi:hypothetical protein